MKEKLEARAAEIEKERDDFVVEANKRIFAYNSLSAELRRLASEICADPVDAPTPLEATSTPDTPADPPATAQP